MFSDPGGRYKRAVTMRGGCGGGGGGMADGPLPVRFGGGVNNIAFGVVLTCANVGRSNN